MSETPAWIAVGVVTRAHGVHGEVAVLPLSQVPSRFGPGATVFRDQDEAAALTVIASRPHRDRILVAFEGIEDRTVAEGLAGTYLFVPASWAPPLPEGAFWPHQLLGSEVVTVAGERVGILSEILHTQANDVWVVAAEGGGEFLVPALRDLVTAVDVAGRRVTVRDGAVEAAAER